MDRLIKIMDKYLSGAKKKVLTLIVNKQWFDMIVSGEKNEEYREIKPYWVARLFQNNSNIVDVRHLALALAGRTDLLKKYIDAQRIVLKQYTHVLFINGCKGSPRIEKKIESITIGKPKKGLCSDNGLILSFLSLNLSDMKVKNLPKKIYLNIYSNEDEVDYNELNGVTFSTEKVGVTDCDTENVPYVNAASLWHDLKEDKPPLRKWVMFRYSGGGVNPTALHYGAMSDDIWIVTIGDGTQRIEALYECYDKIEWFDFDELK